MSKDGKIETVAKPAPKITVADVFADERMRTIKEHEAENPDFVYSWAFGPEVAKSGPGRFKEVVKGVEHGNDVLVRMPRDVYEQKVAIEHERSYQSVAKLRGLNTDDEWKTGNLKQVPKAKVEGKKQ